MTTPFSYFTPLEEVIGASDETLRKGIGRLAPETVTGLQSSQLMRSKLEHFYRFIG